MDIRTAEQIRRLDTESKLLRIVLGGNTKAGEQAPKQRWENLVGRVEPYLLSRSTPGKEKPRDTLQTERLTNVIEVAPSEGSSPATYLQISHHPVGPYLRATWSWGEFPSVPGFIPGVKPHIDPVIESYSPLLLEGDFDKGIALGLLTAVEQSVEVFCQVSQAG